MNNIIKDSYNNIMSNYKRNDKKMAKITRDKIIEIIGKYHLRSNIENSEFSYSKSKTGINFKRNDDKTNHSRVDLRFELEEKNISVLVETKKDSNVDKNLNQLKQYFNKEREYRPNNNIVAIILDLDNILNNNTIVFSKSDNKETILKNQPKEQVLQSMEDYLNYFSSKTNDKEKIIKNTIALNDFLHKINIRESIRSRFIGSILIALNNSNSLKDFLKNFFLENESKKVISQTQTVNTILSKLKENIQDRFSDNEENRDKKMEIVYSVLDDYQVKNISINNIKHILDIVSNQIIPFYNEDTNKGEDLLNLFFTTFNKYVLREDKNQVFTPSHITDFMTEITNINKDSIVLDPTCGSGAFLVQAMYKMLLNVEKNNFQKRKIIKAEQIYGLEIDESAFGLASINMLIHEDGKSNIKNASCFDEKKWISKTNASVVLMNPPFNGKSMPKDADVNNKTGIDNSKGFYFVNFVADAITTKGALLATILPLACAIGSNKIIEKYKRQMLEKHTLKAVFSLPNDIFHPGASASSCIMLFELNKPHQHKNATFFGYYKNDGFSKKKNLGRIEKNDWNQTKQVWVDTFKQQKEIPGFSVLQNIKAEDEWLAEKYLETNYEDLNIKDFVETVKNFLSFQVKASNFLSNNNVNFNSSTKVNELNTRNWKFFKVSDLFEIKKSINIVADDAEDCLTKEGDAVAYVSRTANNNGVNFFVDPKCLDNPQAIQKGNSITIGGESATAFYQPADFITGNNITVLRLQKEKLNPYLGLFFVTLFNKESYRYNYGRAFNAINIKNSKLKLPIKPDGNIDYSFMEEYIQSIVRQEIDIFLKLFSN